VRVRFLLDENLRDPQLLESLRAYNAEMDVLRIGDAGALPLSTPDPDILQYLEATMRTLVTNNRKSMPKYIAEHNAQGGHHGGIIWVRPKATVEKLIESLCIAWESSPAEEWLDKTEWLPV